MNHNRRVSAYIFDIKPQFIIAGSIVFLEEEEQQKSYFVYFSCLKKKKKGSILSHLQNIVTD